MYRVGLGGFVVQGILECKRYLGHCFTELTVDSASQHERACRILPGGSQQNFRTSEIEQANNCKPTCY